MRDRSIPRLFSPCCCVLGLFVATVGFAQSLPAEELSPGDIEFFEKRVRPVLVDRCQTCHGPDNVESGLRLDSLAAVLKGGTRGPALVAKDPKASLLILAVNHADQLHMPPKSKIPQREIDSLAEWVERGAFWPGEKVSTAIETRKSREITDADRNFWSLRPVARPALPEVRDRAWLRSPIDVFVLHRLEEAGLSPSPEAEKPALLRRATFDLTGLPPTPDELDDFLADDSPNAFERVVDRLLASPHYGQRWGRHWLDVARYGDSNGLDENLAFANAFRYRDYVVDAFNDDRPYNEFLAEQIAGDLMPSDDPTVQMRRIVATGFLSLGAKMLAEDDPVKMEMDIIDEQVDTIGRAVLGLTLGCARCHDHKYDPILTTDYYALAGIFKSTKTMDNFSVVARWQERPLATASELQRRDAALAVVNDLKKQVESTVSDERTRILAEVRRTTALYLLAAWREERLLARSAAVTSAPGGDLAKVAGARAIEAENFDRGNVQKDFNTYGQGIGVLVNKGATPNFVEYDIEVPSAGLYQIDIRYAAAGSRPCALSINGKVLRKEAAGQTTGSWTPESQKWFVEGVFLLAAGNNVLRLEHPQFFPHIDKIALVPATDDAVAPELAAELDAATLIPDVVTRWRNVLADPQSRFGAWRHFVKHASWDGFARDDEPYRERLIAPPIPQTLRQLAARYAELLATPQAGHPDSVADELKLKADAGPWAMAAIPETSFASSVRDAIAELRRQQADAERAVPQFPETMAVSEGKPTHLRVHLRGSHVTLGETTARRFPIVFDRGNDPAIATNESGRLQFVQWLTDPSNPLTGRVLVNRLWQHHFGEGLVRSPDNFGRLGNAPTHPELLDWLTEELIADFGLRIADSDRDAGRGTPPLAGSQASASNDWSLKRLHRKILGSATWRQSSAWSARGNEADPENTLLWRMPRRRLEAEAIRDSILFVGGSLDDTFGGSLLPTKNRNYVTSTANVNPQIYVSNRRTIYLPVVRSAVYDFLTAFDFGDPSVMQGRRDRTTVAPQALFLMNSPQVAEQSSRLALQLLAQSDDAARVRQTFRVLYAREPSEDEERKSKDFVQRYRESLDSALSPDDAARRSWQALCRALMTTNEFLYVD